MPQAQWDLGVGSMSAPPTRIIGAGAAVVVLAALPLVLSRPDAEEPAPAEGALTLKLESNASNHTVAIAGPTPAPTQAMTIRDASGQHTAAVKPVASCPATTPRVAFTGQGAIWCLELSNVEAGHELVGTVANTNGDKLTLTVQRRVAFMPLPLGILLAGLAGGVLAGLVPRWLRAAIRRIILERMIRENEPRIKGLKVWANGRRADRASTDELISAIDKVATSGLVAAARARTRLSSSIEQARQQGLSEHQLVKQAVAVADDATNRMADFYSDGKARAAHPAEEWAATVDLLAEYKADLVKLKNIIDNLADARSKQIPNARLREATAALDGLDDAADIDERMTPKLTAVRDAVDRALLSATAMRGFVPNLSSAVPWIGAAPHRREATPLGMTSDATLKAWTWLARTATAALLVLALVYAFLAIKQSAYDGKPMFASFSDYFSLFSAGIASGVSATVLAVVGNWQVDSAGTGDHSA